MSDQITTTFPDHAGMVRWCRAVLEGLRYTVIEPEEVRISQADLCREFNQRPSIISRALRHPSCPKYIGYQSERGSITSLVMNEKLHSWLTARFTR